MNEKDTDVYFSLNEKKLNICVFKNIDDSVIFFNEENININSITENTDFEILEQLLEKNIKQIAHWSHHNMLSPIPPPHPPSLIPGVKKKAFFFLVVLIDVMSMSIVLV